MKRQMNEALREENLRLEGIIEAFEKNEARRIERAVTTGSHAVEGLIRAVQQLARAVPNTAAGVAALKKARWLLELHGVPLPKYLEKEPKPRRVRRKRKSATRAPKTP